MATVGNTQTVGKNLKTTDLNSFFRLDVEYSLLLHETFGNTIPRAIYMLLEHSGNGILWLLLAPAVWLLTPLSPEGRLSVANFFLGLWVDLALVGSLKAIFRRPRPEYNYSGDFILVVSVDQFSFPSGHAARWVRLSCSLQPCVFGLPVMYISSGTIY